MNKRLLLLAPLALALTACGSSGNNGTPSAAPTAATTTAQMAPTPASTTPASATPATSASTAAPSADASAADASSDAQNASSGMDAAAKAAMVKAAHDFVDNGQWVEGKNYFVIEPQQPKVTDTDKVEVVEVFSYGCPACNQAHPMIDKLRADLPAYATMAYLPAGFRPDENWVVYQRAYYAAKALGVADKTYDAMFDATWKTGETATYDLATGRPKPRSQWPDIHDIAKFYAKYGVSPEQFVAVANSFAVNTQIKRADELIKDYAVPATPTIVIDGKYRFSFVTAGTYDKGIALAKWLIAKEAKRLVDQQQAAGK
ncbi:MAG TPA: thiol:disulfide interchange protein DsbA/DsbL [Rhodanobacteraceae bacterium]|nr:thiol:disulfide interchange protein DsbA/DsbL [Rhodanobacteraceae bacterium]